MFTLSTLILIQIALIRNCFIILFFFPSFIVLLHPFILLLLNRFTFIIWIFKPIDLRVRRQVYTTLQMELLRTLHSMREVIDLQTSPSAADLTNLVSNFYSQRNHTLNRFGYVINFERAQRHLRTAKMLDDLRLMIASTFQFNSLIDLQDELNAGASDLRLLLMLTNGLQNAISFTALNG